MIQTFLEADWDDAIAARHARDARLLELQAQGLECRTENLFNILTNHRVYLVEATEPKSLEPKLNDSRDRRKPKDATPRATALPKRVARVQHYENL